MNLEEIERAKLRQNYFKKLVFKFNDKNSDRKSNWNKQFFYKYSFEKLRSKSKILDIGCGVGSFLKLNREIAIGIDGNWENLKKGSKFSENIVQGNIIELPFSDESFDGINCSHVIEHFMPDNAYKLLSEMNRVLKVGGMLVISTPVLGANFYNDFTHIKPYYPAAIMHYYDENKIQRTKNEITCHYKLKEIKWRYEKVDIKPLLFPKAGPLNTLMILFTQWLSKKGFGKYVETGYTMILEKIR